MKLPCSLRFLLFAFAWLAVALSGNAQVAHLVSTPPLGDSLPLTQSPDGVHLKFPVLLNDHTVIEPGATLRLVYVDPDAGLKARGGGGNKNVNFGIRRHHIDTAMPDAPDTNPNVSFSDSSDTILHSKKKDPAAKYGTETWKDAQLFRDAFDQAADIGTMLVYVEPGTAKLTVGQVDLPNGMLLGAPGGKIVVLALTPDGETAHAGVQPQDELRAIAGQPVPENLRGFSHFYREATAQSRAASQPFSLTVWRPAESRLVTLQVGAPPSIPKMF